MLDALNSMDLIFGHIIAAKSFHFLVQANQRTIRIVNRSMAVYGKNVCRHTGFYPWKMRRKKRDVAKGL